jgi:hypothetical protein
LRRRRSWACAPRTSWRPRLLKVACPSSHAPSPYLAPPVAPRPSRAAAGHEPCRPPWPGRRRSFAWGAAESNRPRQKLCDVEPCLLSLFPRTGKHRSTTSAMGPSPPDKSIAGSHLPVPSRPR